MSKRAILLANLGSPDSPTTPAVRRYLNQFLMDPYVIQLPWILRRTIVSLFVLPTRPKASAEAYKSVWTPTGSPLIVLSEQLKAAVKSKIGDMPLALAMRYGNPSIEQQILALTENKEIDEILYIPLYPHFADSTVTTSIEEAKQAIEKHNLSVSLNVLPPFYDNPQYIDALVKSAESYLSQDHDHILFSYHGLPESHITKLDPSGHCLQQTNCCQIEHPAHKTCYRHQVMKTTELFVQQMQLEKSRYSVAFQSRLGRAKWLGPNTEDRLRELAAQGIRHVMVLCPAFVTDCLETLEEIAIRGEEVFKEAGGQKLTLIPCMNDHPAWVNVLSDWCQT
ncbi:MAG TPA: ferrochelatase [Methylophaga aminisulfidivorans]|uniref:Ferrochelatase n=1 Tax=Methylophaga aminisulfidivorans TaxID=230105 RepID=A0A7C1VTU4_9GAMM|nr:ferrochelatase [Methylophaga aminisulfidivorans]